MCCLEYTPAKLKWQSKETHPNVQDITTEKMPNKKKADKRVADMEYFALFCLPVIQLTSPPTPTSSVLNRQ